MKKKTFFRITSAFFFMIALCLVSLTGLVFSIVFPNPVPLVKKFFIFGSAAVSFFGLCFVVINLFSGRIVLTSEWLDFKRFEGGRGAEHKTISAYSEIESVDFVVSANDSFDKPFSGVFLLHTYMCLKCTGGEIKRVRLDGFSAKRVSDMLALLSERTGLASTDWIKEYSSAEDDRKHNRMSAVKWEEFERRLTEFYDSFYFVYNGDNIWIEKVSADSARLVYESAENIKKTYSSPREFLDDPVFDGKTFIDIWNDLV